MKKTLFTLALLALSLFAYLYYPMASQPAGSIVVIVVGKLNAGAVIELQSDGDTSEYELGELQEYRLEELPAASYVVACVDPMLGRMQATLDLAAGEERVIRLTYKADCQLDFDFVGFD